MNFVIIEKRQKFYKTLEKTQPQEKRLHTIH